MAPIIGALIAQGLNLLGNAVLSKGKEVIEQKIGVKIPDKVEDLTPEKLTELKKAEMAHEEFLVNAALQRREQDIKEYGQQIDDTKAARERDIALLQAGYRNSRANVMLAGAGLGVVAILFVAIWVSPLDDFVKGILTLILGRALGYIDQGFNFEFGTTRSSGKKDDIISNLSKQ